MPSCFLFTTRLLALCPCTNKYYCWLTSPDPARKEPSQVPCQSGTGQIWKTFWEQARMNVVVDCFSEVLAEGPPEEGWQECKEHSSSPPWVHFTSWVLTNLNFIGTADGEMRFVGGGHHWTGSVCSIWGWKKGWGRRLSTDWNLPGLLLLRAAGFSSGGIFKDMSRKWTLALLTQHSSKCKKWWMI